MLGRGLVGEVLRWVRRRPVGRDLARRMGAGRLLPVLAHTVPPDEHGCGRDQQGERRPDDHRRVRVPVDEAGGDGATEDQDEVPVVPEGAEPGVRAGRVALGRHHELALAAQGGVDQRLRVERCRQRGHDHAGHAAGALRLVRGDVVAAVPDVEADLERGGVAVEHQPDRGVDVHTRGAQAQEQRTAQCGQDPVEGRHRVEDDHHGVVEELARRQRVPALPVLLEDRLVRSPRPAHLLGEEVRPGVGALTDREHVRGVDRAPLPARRRVLGAVHLEAGRHVLGDRVVQAADLLERLDAHSVGRADEHGGAVAVAGPLDERVEEELLRLGGLGDEVVVVPVDLRADDEADVRVAEEAEHPFQVVRQRNVVGVHRGEELVVVAVRVEPGVVVAVLGLGAVRALGLVPLRDALAGEVVHTEARADLLHLGVVALVEQPDVHGAPVADLDRGLQGLRHHLQRLLAGHEGGEEGDPGAGLGHDGDRIAGDQRGVRVGQHVHAAEELDQTDRDEHHDVEGGQPVERRVVALRPVRGLEQPHQQHHRQQGGRGQHQRDADAVRLLRDQRAVLHRVRLVRIGLGEGPREPAVMLVVVSRQCLLDPAESARVSGPVRRHPELGGLGRVVVPLGARRRRRHECHPPTHGLAACFVASFRPCPVPLDLSGRVNGGSLSPRHPHHIDTAQRSLRLRDASPAASPGGRDALPRTVRNRSFAPQQPRTRGIVKEPGWTGFIMIARCEIRCPPVIWSHCDF